MSGFRRDTCPVCRAVLIGCWTVALLVGFLALISPEGDWDGPALVAVLLALGLTAGRRLWKYRHQEMRP